MGDKNTSYHGCDAIMHFPLPEVCTFIKNAMRIIPIWYRLPEFGPLAHGLEIIDVKASLVWPRENT